MHSRYFGITEAMEILQLIWFGLFVELGYVFLSLRLQKASMSSALLSVLLVGKSMCPTLKK
jgi:hypothetical protein